MPHFDRGTVIRVPFPYTNRPVQQRRPAVIVSSTAFAERTHLLWVIMVTSAENRPWPGDVDLAEHFAEFGLPAPSIVRTAKIATIEADHAEPIGRVSEAVLQDIDRHLRENLAF